MQVNYNYWFHGKVSLPDFIWKETQNYPNGWAEVRLNPARSDAEWREHTLHFWRSIQENKISGKWHCVTTFFADDWRFSRSDFKRASLYALDTACFFLGQEVGSPVDSGCPVCGHGRIIAADAEIDERTVISWRSGFTNLGRFTVHVSVYEQLLKAGVTGFQGSVVKCARPNDYCISLWRGSLEKVKRDLEDFPGATPEGIEVQEWTDTLLLLAPPEVVEGGVFDEMNKYLLDLHDREVLTYKVIPPAAEVGDMERTRWVALEVTGVAGTELDVNEYDAETICPRCGKGGRCPTGVLRIDTRTADGSDLCVTETGRICASRRAFEVLSSAAGHSAEPVRCLDG